MALLLRNATASTYRGQLPNQTPILAGVRVTLRKRKVVYTPVGPSVETHILFDPGASSSPTDLRDGDWISITQVDGDPAYRATRQYQAALVDRIGGALAYIDVTVVGGLDYGG